MRVKLWLTFYVNDLEGPTTTFWREMETEALPGVGDGVIVYSFDEPDDGVIVNVKRRVWRVDGGIDVELLPFVIDPTDRATQENLATIRLSRRPLFDDWMSRDGAPEPVLIPSGWQ